MGAVHRIGNDQTNTLSFPCNRADQRRQIIADLCP